jgi:predicted metal-dependent phosphoesterase TrpH
VVKVELHSHTADDPTDYIPHSTYQLIDRAVELGYGALAITLHDRQLDIRPYTDYARQRSLTLIPGIERTIEGKHVLLLNFSRATEDVETFKDLAQLRANERGLVVAPHPYFPSRTCLGSLLDANADLFDAVEYNAMFTTALNFNQPAVRWAASHGKPLVGNGDVHRLRQLGTTYSLVDAPLDADAICEAIRRNHVRVESTALSVLTAARLMAGMFAANFRTHRDARNRKANPRHLSSATLTRDR